MSSENITMACTLANSFIASGRFAPVGFLFEKVGRVQVSIPPVPDRDAQIEALLDIASSAGGDDFDVIEGTNIVEVRVHRMFIIISDRRLQFHITHTSIPCVVFLLYGSIRSRDKGYQRGEYRGRALVV